MAYTYDDFVTAANGAGLMDIFSDDDLNIAKVSPEYGLSMLKLQQDINGAKTTEQRLLAEEAQKQLRTTYSGPAAGAVAGTQPATGTQPSTTDAAGSTGSFTFSGQSQLDDLIDKTVNRDPFSYKPKEDESYISARKSYLREAERAREDTMARAAAVTGGTPSSFAVTAAQQAGDYHLTQFADKAAALEQNAYQRYLNEYQQDLSDIGVLTEQRDFDYAAYLKEEELNQQKFQNAMALYQQYRYTMRPEQLKQLFADLGYLTPAVQTFLDSTAIPTAGYYAPVPSGKPKPQSEPTWEEIRAAAEAAGYTGVGGYAHKVNPYDKVNKTGSHGVTR